MKKIHRLKWLMGLAMVASIAMMAPAYAQDEKAEYEIEGSKVTGSLKIGHYYNFPDGSKHRKYYAAFNQLHNAGLGLESILPFREDTVKFVVQTKLARAMISLKRISLELEHFIAGLTDSNFCDSGALPKTLLGDDTPNSVAGRGVQIGWKDQLEEGISYGIALEEPLQSRSVLDIVTQTGKNKQPTHQSFPKNASVGAHIKYKQDFGYVRLGGLFMTSVSHSHKKPTQNPNYNVGLWGANLTGVFQLQPDEQTMLKIAGLYGKGLGSYLAGASLVGKKVAGIVAFKDNQPILLGTLGGSIAVEHFWLPQLRSTFAYGILGTTENQEYKKKVDKKSHKDCYKRSQYASVNLIYDHNENLMYGIEYLYDRLRTLDPKGDQCKRRLQIAVGFKL